MRQVLFVIAIFIVFTSFGIADIGSELQKKMNNARDDQFFQVMVVFKESLNPGEIYNNYGIRSDSISGRAQVMQIMKNKAEQSQHWVKSLAKTRSAQVKDLKSFWIANLLSLKAKADAIKEIADQPNVKTVFLDEEQQFIHYKAGTPMRDAWGLAKIGSDVLNQNGFTGKGIVVAVIDTGVNYNHNELKNRVIMGLDAYNNDMDPLDDNGHGSHCAGTIAGTTYGVAPEATILAIKVLSGWGSGSWKNVADGVQYVAEYQKDGKVINVASMSLGGRSPINSDLKTAFENVMELTVTHFIVAAGNSGPSEKTIGTPGDLKSVITIGATDINDNIASFSSRGPVVAYGEPYYIKPDVCAPGVNITSCWKGDADAQNTISGTSMATPHVAGLAALICQKYKNIKRDKMRKILEKCALDLGEEGLDNVYGYGRVQGLEAIKVAAKLESRERFETEETLDFTISGNKVHIKKTQANPLWWAVNVKVWATVLEPNAAFEGTFKLTNSDGEQTGSLTMQTGTTVYVGRYRIAKGNNTLEVIANCSGSSAAKGKIKVKVKTD